MTDLLFNRLVKKDRSRQLLIYSYRIFILFYQKLIEEADEDGDEGVGGAQHLTADIMPSAYCGLVSMSEDVIRCMA